VALGDLLDLIFPRRCVVCELLGSDLCDRCLARIPRLPMPLCERCGAPTSWPVRRCRECSGRRVAFATARAAVVYDAGVRALVAAWKERGLRRVAALAGQLVEEQVACPPVEAVTFVPPDRDRALTRGHHPAAALARDLSRRWQLELVAALERTRITPRQTGLPLAVRRRNVAGAFAPAGPVARNIAIADDVYTTGATASAAASALRRGGARRVHVVTFARAVR
jgi:predicted amidophosphoribosyltransferase